MPYTYICPWSWLHNVCLNFSERFGEVTELGGKWELSGDPIPFSNSPPGLRWHIIKDYCMQKLQHM